METREEKLFVSMQYRLQQASTNDRERRMLLSQLESRIEAEKEIVRSFYVIILLAKLLHTQNTGFAASGMLSAAIQATSNEVYVLHKI